MIEQIAAFRSDKPDPQYYAEHTVQKALAELAERPVRDRAARDVKSVVHTMMLEDQKPRNADQLIEDEAQRRLNRNKPR